MTCLNLACDVRWFMMDEVTVASCDLLVNGLSINFVLP